MVTTDTHPSQRRKRWSLRAAIGISLAMFVGLLLARNHLRAEWCRWKITHTDTPAEQAHYLGGLLSLGPPAHSAIGRLAEDPRPETRCLAIAALATLPPETAVPTLARLLDDRDEDVRLLTASTLGLADAPQARAALINTLQSPSPNAAQAAAAGLARVPPTTSLVPLTQALLDNPNPLVRAQAIESIGELLTQIKDHPNDQPKDHPADAPLTDVSLRETIAALVKSLTDQQPFKGRLALEQEIAAALAYMQTTTSIADDDPSNPDNLRTVAEVALTVLSKLSGTNVAATAPWDGTTAAKLTEQCLAMIRGQGQRD